MPTVYVATSSPDGVHSSVGALDWFVEEAHANEAADKFRQLAAEGDVIAVNSVEVPDDVYRTSRVAVTEYLYDVVDF